MSRRSSLPTLLAVLVLLSVTTLAAAQGLTPQSALGTGFTYQGRLGDGGGPANGSYDFQFQLFDAAAGGAQVGSAVTVQAVIVSGGLFSVNIDFGTVFDGRALFLEVSVRPGGSAGAYTTLSPRQPVTAVPYALALPGLRTQPNATSPNVIGGFSGNSVSAGVVGATIGGGGLQSNLNSVTANYATVSGGSGNTASGDWSLIGGGKDNVASSVGSIVAGGRLNVVSGDYSTIGGGIGNKTGPDVATVAGGIENVASGNQSTVSGGTTNHANGENATVGGGSTNIASAIADTVSGGDHNTAGGGGSTVGGGTGNTATGLRSVVAGGSANQALGVNATVSGGGNNTTNALGATVGGGFGNSANGRNSTVSGGVSNTAGGEESSVGGGFANRATGKGSAIPGGIGNEAVGENSFAAGTDAKATQYGTFVWADLIGLPFNSGGVPNSFNVRSTGGIYLWTGANGSSGDGTVGAALPAGSGSWSSVSDRNAKTNIAAITPREVLARVAGLPMQTWSYKTQDAAIRHIGPMAQDFYAAFGVGEDNKHISTVDADGVALAAIQGLYQANQEQAARIAALEARLASADTNAGIIGSGLPVTAVVLSGGLAVLVLIGFGMLLLWQRRSVLGVQQPAEHGVSNPRSLAEITPARMIGVGSARGTRKAKSISASHVAPPQSQRRTKASRSAGQQRQRRGGR